MTGPIVAPGGTGTTGRSAPAPRQVPPQPPRPGWDRTSPRLCRVGGLALVVGAGVFIAHLLARSVLTASAGGDTAAFARAGLWLPINALGAAGAALVLLGLPAVCARISGPTGWLGVAGVVLIALGWMVLGGFVSLYSASVLPWLADNAPALVDTINQAAGLLIVFIIGLLAQLIGTVLLAIPFLRGRVRPNWVGYVLVASVLMTLIGNLVIAPSGPATNLALNLLSNLGPVLLLVALGALGARLWSEDAPARHAAPSAPGSPG
jgi:hypothetical protein